MSLSTSEALIGRLAVEHQILTEDQVLAAMRQKLEQQIQWDFGEYLVAQGVLSPEDLLTLERLREERAERPESADVLESGELGEAEEVPEVVDRLQASGMPESGEQLETADVLEDVELEETNEPPSAAAPSISYEPGTTLENLLRQAAAMRANDLHLHSGARLRVRVDGLLRDASTDPIPAEVAERLIFDLLDADQAARLKEELQLDFIYSIPEVGRFRGNAYRQHHGLDAVFRPIPTEPPSIADLGLPPSLEQLTKYHQGLVLLTGPAGCGKSSTMAALIDLINKTRQGHILVIEDPVEYVHRSKGCIVNQREVGRHTETFPRALRAALREDPDVIVIGELRDLETVSLALTAAETGHLVLGTLHTGSAVRTIHRVLGVFPPDQQEQVRLMLSESLVAIVSQHLLQRSDGSGRVAALELLFNTKAIANLIRDKKTFQIPSAMQTAAAQGMVLLDQSLARLVREGLVTKEEARRFAEDPNKVG